MNDHLENTEHLDEIELTPPGQKSVSEIYGAILAKRKAEREKRREEFKQSSKEKREAELARRNQYLEVDAASFMDDFDLSMARQRIYRNGNVIPEVFDMNLYNNSGFSSGQSSSQTAL